MSSRTKPAKKSPNPTDSKTGGKAVRLPDDVYLDLCRLQGIYPGMNLGQLAEMLLRKGMSDDETELEKLRKMEKRLAPPPKSK